MVKQPQQRSDELTKLPIVDGHVLHVLRDSYAFNPDSPHNWQHHTVDEDQALAHQIVIEANRRNGGDMARQAAFVEGANYVREALRRTVAINRIESSDLFDMNDVFSGTDEVGKIQPALEATKKRLGFGTLSAVVAVLSIIRHPSRRHPNTA